jgi:kinesin family protein 3/17
MEGFQMSDLQANHLSPNPNVEDRGIIPRAIEQIFGHIQAHASQTVRFLVRASYLQIYNEGISDLLKPERNNLAIREDKKKGVFVEGLSEWVVRSPAEIYGLMERGGAVRATGSTKMNEISSRSHAVFIIIVEQSQTEIEADVAPSNSGAASGKAAKSRVKQSFKVGKLNLVDLAGSERVRLSGATGQRLEESKKINQSLSALGNVIAALTDTKGRQHIPYRDSKLTRILEDSLGGNCKTTMMAMISPALEAMVESLSTLKFANRAKNIKNEPKINEDLDQKSLLRKYERELKRLRAELEEKNKNVVDKRRLLEIDEQRRRAEADKMAAIRALESRSLEFMREKEEKRKLEEEIARLTNQMIRGEGGEGDQNGDGGNSHMTKQYKEQVRKEYEGRLAEIEKERETIEEEKAQVDRYKQLLLKQRDIMIALTQRLNERDEQIMALQDELDAYDRHQKELEERLDEKTAQLIHLQRVTLENTAGSPVTDEKVANALGEWSGGGQQQALMEVMDQEASAAKMGDLSISDATAAAASAIASNQSALLDTKQFHPFKTVDSSDNMFDATSPASSAPSKSTQMLDARQKIGELEALLSKSLQEQTDTAKQLDEVQAEKVSIEYLLRENSNSQQQQAQTMSEELSQAKKRVLVVEEMLTAQQGELEELRRVAAASAVGGKKNDGKNNDDGDDDAAAVGSEQLQRANERCDTLVKERRAIKTIMESKVKVLVNSVAQSTHAVLNQSQEVMTTPAGQSLAKDMAALKRLVHAAVSALANADT